jgi:DNA-binding GntR family transcriptional regulator
LRRGAVSAPSWLLFGQKVAQLNQDISAALISPELAVALEVAPGSPAILVRRACRTADDKLVEANIELYPASRSRYAVTLHRAKKAHRDG